ncbi:crotonase/enoyl-CoA hydratase family protein [Paracoccus sp. p3-h83]|uniref:crotonase/enoyl-CoA hydratase family protein n=1 Tax=Paracoccus sp. p3-h83 TaxID=3342805 RepID=UPI0035BAB162
MARVQVTVDQGVAQVTLNRPDKINAVDQAMIDGVLAAAQDLAARDDLRVVVIHGAGRGFCSGLDVVSFAALAAGDPVALIHPRSHGDANAFQAWSLAWRDLPVPVIAALHGPCFGAGLQLALGADIRIAAPDTRLAVMEMKWGLIPDMGGMVTLPGLVRDDWLRRLTYTARPVDAQTGRDIGLVTELADDPLSAALELAHEIAAKSPSAIRAAKRLAGQARHLPRAEMLMAESREQAALIGQPDQMAAIAANLSSKP